MKLLWLCNRIPAVIQKKINGEAGSGLWVDHVLEDLLREDNLRMHVLCMSGSDLSGTLDARCSYGTFAQSEPYVYVPAQEERFRRELAAFLPDVIHIWGTEYAHTLAMVNAAEKEGMLDRVVISIQGLCSVYADHYAEGLPPALVYSSTFRDAVRRDNIHQQRQKFVRRGELEVEALKKVSHVIGRTDWDRACTLRLNPAVTYHKCNETLRPVFYQDSWDYGRCRKHRIFASSSAYSVKGFHYLLEAFAEVRKVYPDATLAVPGKAPCGTGLRVNSYEKYLHGIICRHGLQEHIAFLGSLSAEGMKEQYLAANVFALPSTIENSPNSLGEAMLLGTPCVSADVGGVTTMMTHNTEGFVYQSTAPYMLAYYICQVFAMEENAGELGRRAHAHALVTHDPEKNLQDLICIYETIASKE